MGDKGIITLVNPAIALMIALTFMVLWTRQRQQNHILAFAAAYLLMAIGLINFYLADFNQHVADTIASNCSYMVGTLLLAFGLCRRGKVPFPGLVLVLFALVGAAGAIWFAIGQVNLVGRIYAVNFSIGGMFIVTAMSLHTARSHAAVDKLLFWVVALTGVQFFVRTFVSLYLDAGMTTAVYHGSYYWAILNFFMSLFSLTMAAAVIAAVANDIMQKIARDADRDPLTDLPNRRGFDRAAQRFFSSARSDPASLIIVDVDHFKSFNDRLGHPAGDAVLQELGNLLSATLSGDQIAARFGGEEFFILLPNANLAAARLFAENIRTQVEQTSFRAVPEFLKITVSAGVAERQAGQTFEELYGAADRALYQAKNAGRNCVRTATPYFTAASPPLSTVRFASGH